VSDSPGTLRAILRPARSQRGLARDVATSLAATLEGAARALGVADGVDIGVGEVDAPERTWIVQLGRDEVVVAVAQELHDPEIVSSALGAALDHRRDLWLTDAAMERVAAASPLAPGGLRRAARHVAAHGGTIDRLAAAPEEDAEPVAAAERALATVAPALEIAVTPTVARAVAGVPSETAVASHDLDAYGDYLADLLSEPVWAAVGVLLPQPRVVADPALPPGTARVKVNDAPLAPVVLGEPGDAVVALSSDLPGWDGNGRPVLLPDGRTGLLLSEEQATAVDPALLTAARDATSLLPYHVARLVLEHAAALVDVAVVDHLLEQLAESFPTTVRLARERFALELLSAAVRRVLAGGGSAYHLLGALEAFLLSAETADTADAEALAAAARGRLGVGITDASVAHTRLCVYRLENGRGAGAHPDPSLIGALLAAESARDTDVTRPVLLVDAPSRDAVAQLVRPSFPRLPVRADDELPPAPTDHVLATLPA
jgi:hypothetical protein